MFCQVCNKPLDGHSAEDIIECLAAGNPSIKINERFNLFTELQKFQKAGFLLNYRSDGGKNYGVMSDMYSIVLVNEKEQFLKDFGHFALVHQVEPKKSKPKKEEIKESKDVVEEVD